MKKQNADIFASELSKIKSDNLEELYLIIKYSFENLLFYQINKKTKSDIPKKCINVIKEFARIINEERKIINFLLNHISYIEEDNLNKYIEKLEALNIKTINYFYNHLDDIEDAIRLDDLNRINTKRDFKTLSENNEIKREACNIILSKEFIKGYLGYEDDFWTYIDARTIFLKNINNYKMDWEYEIGNQVKMTLYLPAIKDLNTALICCKAYSRAHILYINHNKQSMEFPKEKIKKYYQDICNYFNVE